MTPPSTAQEDGRDEHPGGTGRGEARPRPHEDLQHQRVDDQGEQGHDQRAVGPRSQPVQRADEAVDQSQEDREDHGHPDGLHPEPRGDQRVEKVQGQVEGDGIRDPAEQELHGRPSGAGSAVVKGWQPGSFA